MQVTKRYIKFDEAADCLIGRILAGLNVQSPDFMILPPSFMELNDFVNAQIIQLYGTIEHPKLQNVAPFLLASIVCHYDWIQQTLPSDHVFWKSGIKDVITTQLHQLVSVDSNGQIIPQLKEIMLDGIITLRSEQEKLSKLAPLSAAASGMMCGEAQLNTLKRALTEAIASGFRNLHQEQVFAPISESDSPNNVEEDGFPLYMWGGKFRYIPESYIQDLDQRQPVLVLWKRWW